jgi:trigger factor
MEKGIRYQLIESSIIEENKIKISPDDIKALFRENVEKQMMIYGRKNISEEELNNIVKRLMDNQDEVKRVYNQILNEKFTRFLMKKVNLSPSLFLMITL